MDHDHGSNKFQYLQPTPLVKVEYLSRLIGAYSALEYRIRERIPAQIMLKDRRCRFSEVGPHDRGYDGLLKTFIRDVSSNQAVSILVFLYQHEKYLGQDVKLFSHNFAKLFESLPAKWQMVMYNFPKIDQTTLSIILSEISETVIG
jgi:hypothetical protein